TELASIHIASLPDLGILQANNCVTKISCNLDRCIDEEILINIRYRLNGVCMTACRIGAVSGAYQCLVIINGAFDPGGAGLSCNTTAPAVDVDKKCGISAQRGKVVVLNCNPAASATAGKVLMGV